MLKLPVYKNLISKAAGVSLVELLISLVIGSIILAGAVQVVANSKRSFIDQDEITFIQNNARFALDVISKDIRLAGYMGCASPGSVKVANAIAGNENGFVSMDGIKGFDGGTVDVSTTGTFPANYSANAFAGTDSILIRHADIDNELNVKSHDVNAAVIHTWGTNEFDAGEALVIADANCRYVGLFQVSTGTGSASNVTHNTGGGDNCTKIIRGEFNCSSPSCGTNSCNGYTKVTGGSYGPGSKLMKLISHAYYIGESDIAPGMPALKRHALESLDDATPVVAEEIALGVEDFQIIYGLDSSGDGSVDQYRDASSITTDADWARVLSVKLKLIFRSKSEVLPSAEVRTLAGKTYNDRYIRQLVNSTVRIRNRG